MFEMPTGTIIPNEFFNIDLKQLSTIEYKIMAFIMFNAMNNEHYTAVISNQDFAKATNISIRSIQRATKSLERKNRIMAYILCQKCHSVKSDCNATCACGETDSIKAYKLRMAKDGKNQ